MAPRAGEGFRASMRMVGVTKLLNLFGWALLVAILFDLVRGTTAADVKALRGAMAEKSATAARGEGGFLATYGDDWKEGGVKGTMMLDINKAMASAAANAKADAHEPKWSYEQASQWQPLNDPASPLFKAGFNKWHTSTDGIRFLNEDGVRQVDCKATKPIVHDMRFACNELNAKSTKNGNVKVKAKATASGRKLLQMPPDEFKGFVGVSNVAHGDDGMPVWNTRVPTPPGYVPTPYSQVTHPAVVAAHAAVLGQAVHTIPVHTVQPVVHTEHAGTTINIVSGRKLLQMPPEEFKGMLGVSNVAHGDDGMPVWNNRFASAHAYGMGWLPNSYMYSAMNMQGYWGCASLTATGHCQGDPAFLGGFGAIHGIHTPIHPAVPAVVTSHTTTTTQHALEPSSGGVTINVHA